MKAEPAPARKGKPGKAPRQQEQQQEQLIAPAQGSQRQGLIKSALGKRGRAEGQQAGTDPAAKKNRHAADKPSKPAPASHAKPHAARSAAAQKEQPAAPPATGQRKPSSTPDRPHSQPSAPRHSQPGSVHAALPSSSSGATPTHAFQVDDPRDHAETPFEAYRDLEPLLFRLAQLLGKPKDRLRIYDPYFCAGSCVNHLSRLGFTNVYNRNEDFYSAQAQGTVPEFDVLVTNPPFSGDHMRRALDFAARCGRPWALLLPDFVARKSYYAQVLELPGVAGSGPQSHSRRPDDKASSHSLGPSAAVTSPLCGPLHYLAPATQPYKFSAPQWHAGEPQGSGAASAAGKTFTPASFQCVWFLALGASNAAPIANWWRKKHEAGRPGAASSCVLSADVKVVPQLSLDPNRKRREEEAGKRSWRKKLSRQRKNAAKAQAGGS